MRSITLIFLTGIFCLSGCGAELPEPSGKCIVAYVTSWSNEMPDPQFMTHINYAFGHVNQTFDGVRIDNPERLSSIAGLKKDHPSLSVMLSIGGWGSGGFSEMAAEDSLRRSFARDCLRVAEEFGLDGIDMDWEYPTNRAAGISATLDDTDNFTLLIKELRAVLGERYLLTMASSAGAGYVDFEAVEPYLDFVNIMTYDMGGGKTHHSALYRSEMTGWLSGDEAVNLHLKAGVPPEKLTLGIPFYGHAVSGLGNFIDYRNITGLEGYTEMWDEVAQSPFLVDESGESVCTFDNVRSVNIKTGYIKDKGLKGAMYWDYSGDDSLSTLRRTVLEGMAP